MRIVFVLFFFFAQFFAFGQVSDQNKSGNSLNIVEALAFEEGIKKFQNAVVSSGILNVLYENKLFTIFAPEDNAFINPGECDKYLSEEQVDLKKYGVKGYIVEGVINLDEIDGEKTYKALNGNELKIVRIDGGSFLVNGSLITEVSSYNPYNGKLYIIGKCLKQ